MDRLQGCKVLELGAGTGVFPVCLFADMNWARSSARPIRWCTTDRAENIPLLRKNVLPLSSEQAQFAVEELDWFHVQECVERGSSHGLHQIRRTTLTVFRSTLDHSDQIEYPDLILCIDCIYNPGLHDALITTLKAFSGPKTTILTVVHLREVENTRTFLQKWIDCDCFTTYSLEEEFLPLRMRHGYALWIAWPRQCGA